MLSKPAEVSLSHKGLEQDAVLWRMGWSPGINIASVHSDGQHGVCQAAQSAKYELVPMILLESYLHRASSTCSKPSCSTTIPCAVMLACLCKSCLLSVYGALQLCCSLCPYSSELFGTWTFLSGMEATCLQIAQLLHHYMLGPLFTLVHCPLFMLTTGKSIAD